MLNDDGSYSRKCPHCGRTWYVAPDRTANVGGRGGWTGFLEAAIDNHVSTCESRTPAERRATNRRDEARWKRNPPRTSIWNNPNHPGLVDDDHTGV
jgi:hypothetical protein